ncbi:MAG: endonuclease MutS2 [Candidatus Marinimicrobia bacterium]|jgi:DNA mismatch repair protein MutS2|nr:endonuclease MutS2 [Candidatus Neomarinimicrobiota bacterium]MBT4713277.1 endonuclease MutS2 [Candidatus Neomarinimicrobiota bacterium]MBT4944797.1 endonuclease MutS2 [Candidatus Neomarinimicrobiota bacterium]MBT5271634.1 endonuclease MutS2 [Candidatus Neomarinimicrobiota bacterium]MBT6010008.1 endonuclease MutS2 [Candidatus Neomarinimicrobiota bacterium]
MDSSDSTNSSNTHLGFDDVRQWLADEAAGISVTHQFEKLQPKDNPIDIREQYDRIAAIEALMDINSSFYIRPYDELHEILKLLALDGSTLYPEDLKTVHNILEQSRTLKNIYQNHPEEEISIWDEDFQNITPLLDLEKDILKIVGPDGEVLDNASSTLSSLRRKLRKSGGAVRTRMADLVKKYGESGYLNESQAGIKAGRLVLPVISSYKGQVQGVIQDMSNTGTTTFIEPFEIIELNNQIKTIEIEEQQEVQRILQELTGRLHLHHSTIRQNYKLLEILDYHTALVKFGKTFACTIPTLSEDGSFLLKSARNPRLALQRKVVPLELAMDSQTNTLIITGPNAGGKTVALKTIGLLALMANAGVPVPAAEGSVIPFVDKIFTDIGDQQSLVDDLSTFSAHLSTIISILDQTTSQSLVLLDELGTGTDPAEGAALARSILESLGGAGVKTVATTHLGDLKVFAHEAENVMNGAMEFDQKGLKPTYKFLAGVPGSSYGFEISKRLGLSDDILKSARGYIGWARDSMEKLLRSLEAERATLSGLKSDNTDLQRDLKMKQKRMDTALESVQKAERKADRDAAKKAGQIITDARQTVEQVIKQIKESQAGKENIKEVRGTLDQIEAELEKVIEETEEPLKLEKLRSEDVTKGLEVTVFSLDQIGVVLEKSIRGKTMVEVDGKRMRVPIEWLGKAPQKKATELKSTTVVNVSDRKASTYSLDLRGFRADAAIEELGRFIDQAVLNNLSIMQIIHGKGTGVIKQVVHEVLDKHPAVKTKRLGGLDEGGAGITFVELK